MEETKKCVRCFNVRLLRYFTSVRDSKRHGEDMGPWKVFKTCRPCRVRKNAKSRDTYAENNEGVCSRGPQKDLVCPSLLLMMTELEWDLFFAKRFEEDYDKNEFL